MNRIRDWTVALGELAREVIGAPFEWGETDCVSVFRRALVAMYGKDIAAPYIDVTYTTKVGATRAFNKVGGYEDTLLKMGAKEVPPHLTRDGDVMVFPKGEGNFENVMTKMGGAWIMSDPASESIIPVHINPYNIGKEAKVFRIV